MVMAGGDGEGINRELGMERYTHLCLRWITNKDLLCSAWNSAQCYVAAWMGRGDWGRMDTCICMAESLCYPPETHNIVNGLYVCMCVLVTQSCLTLRPHGL